MRSTQYHPTKWDGKPVSKFWEGLFCVFEQSNNKKRDIKSRQTDDKPLHFWWGLFF